MDTYRAELLNTIAAWDAGTVDEWMFERFRDKWIRILPRHMAFQAMDETAGILLAQGRSPHSLVEIVDTISALARRCDTTEVPPTLRTLFENTPDTMSLGTRPELERCLAELRRKFRC